MYFEVACGKFGLLSHIDGTSPAAPDDPSWAQADSCVRTWLFTSMAEDVSDMAVAPGQTARQLFQRTCSLFTDNRDTRAIYLRKQFHTLVQGDLSVTEYFQRLKNLADALLDVGRKIDDDMLVLNALRGLNPRYKTAADIISFREPLPDFAKARDLLVLYELSDPNEVDVAATALVSTTAPPCSGGFACASSSSRAPAPPPANPPRGGGKGKNHGGKGRQPYQPRAPAPTGPTPPTGPWVCMTPWGPAASIGQPWPAPPRPSAGILGPRPAPASAQQAYTTTTTTMAPVQASNQKWDQASLIAALNAMQTASQTGWVMDSGASSHMAADDGSSYRDHDSTLQ